jgi:Fe-S cluster biogenesis protein NfuA
MEDRVRAAIDEIRPLLESHGGGIDFVKLEGATVFVRLRGACNGCPGALMTLKQGVERRVKELVPEVESVEAVR